MRKERFIPNNVLQINRLAGFKKRNLAEGGVWAVSAGLITNAIPFVSKVKWIVIICVGLALIVANAFGINGYPVSATVLNWLKYRYYLNQFSYRRLKKDVGEYKSIVTDKNKVRTITATRSIKNIRKFFGQ